MAKRIMAIDDSRTMRQMLSITLQNNDYHVLEACDGQDAIDRLSDDNCPEISLILCDVNMPNVGGIEVVKTLRAMDKYARTPILMLTTESEAPMIQAGKDAGATGWIVKPFTPEQLVDVIGKVLA